MESMPEPIGAAHDLRVLIFTPEGSDVSPVSDLLARERIACRVCRTIGEVRREVERASGALLLQEEALDDPELPQLTAGLKQQPRWSDLPVLLFVRRNRSQALLQTMQLFEKLGNITLLDRPIRNTAVITTVRAALRARERQYEMRGVLLALRRARDDAERANRLKDEFLATLSHELRTPLNAILGWVSMLRRTPVQRDRLPYALGVIERNAVAQTELINQVLDVSRIITGRVRLNPESLDVRQLVERALESVRPAADAKMQTVVVHASDDLRPIHGDRECLQQVFWNLLSNAVKFTPQGGRVEIQLRHMNSAVEVAVIDTGIGVPSEFLPFVFDRFRQADQSFTRDHGV